MRAFEYVKPESVEDACRALSERGDEAAVIAGGQTLLLEMKARRAWPGAVIDIGRLADLRGHASKDGGLRIGPCTTYTELSEASDLQQPHQMLTSVAGNLADRSVRNLGTLGGAICAAEPHFDVPVAVVALDGQLELRSTTGVREIDASTFFTGARRTERQPDEILEAVRVDGGAGDVGWAFEKFRRRLFDPAVASIAITIQFEESGTVRKARLVAGSVQEVPTRLRALEEDLAGELLDESRVRDAGDAAADELKDAHAGARGSLPYLKDLVRQLTVNALRSAKARARIEAEGG